MKKRIFTVFVLALLLVCVSLFPCKINCYADEVKTVYLGGYATGFSIKTRGADIVGLSDVITDYGVVCPAKESGVLVDDKLLSVNDVEINGSKDIEKALEGSCGEKVVLIIKRKGESIIKEVEPVKDINGSYKLGLFIRDNLNGIGTMTFIKKNGEFMALGHPIVDECNSLCEIVSGELFRCSIIGVNKGVRGKAGELKGIFIKDDAIGSLSGNFQQGIRGKMSSSFDLKSLKEIEIGKAKVGSAKIVTSIDGVEPREYDINIVKTDDGAKSCKNFVIKVTDDCLLDMAGGIVQGMSGSPIVQNGKLVGAVTHVFLNDPTRGYGITIDNMLNA